MNFHGLHDIGKLAFGQWCCAQVSSALRARLLGGRG
jgi:hypothetical protein